MLLGAMESGGDVLEALDEVGWLHPKNDTFPGEVFVRLGAGALAVGGVDADRPIAEEGLIGRYLPECRFRGRDNHKIRYALLAVAATHSGVEVELLDEVVYWGTDDFWRYAGLAAVAWIRAVSDQRGVAVPDLCQQLRERPAGRGG